MPTPPPEQMPLSLLFFIFFVSAKTVLVPLVCAPQLVLMSGTCLNLFMKLIHDESPFVVYLGRADTEKCSCGLSETQMQAMRSYAVSSFKGLLGASVVVTTLIKMLSSLCWYMQH